MNGPDAASGPDGLLAWALDAGRFGLALLDDRGHVIHANQAACALLGCGQRDVIGRQVADLVHPDDRGWVDAELELLLAGTVDRIRQEARLAGVGDGDARTELNVRLVAAAPGRPVYAVMLLEDAGDRSLREQELRRLAETDPLTGLLNRRRFAAELDLHAARTARYGARGALLLLDIDGLKGINDNHGHLAGDQAIVAVATLLREHTRSSDVIARLGGDEFVVLLPVATRQHAITATTTLLGRLRANGAAGLPAPPTVSVGIAIVTDAIGASGLLHVADAAMYEAKRSGGDTYRINPPEHIDAGSPGVSTPL